MKYEFTGSLATQDIALDLTDAQANYVLTSEKWQAFAPSELENLSQDAQEEWGRQFIQAVNKRNI